MSSSQWRMPERAGGSSGAGSALAGGRLLSRALLIVAIAGLAWYRGLAGPAVALLALLVLWAASLPWLLRAIARSLRGVAQPWRNTFTIGAAAAMLAAFFAAARAAFLRF